MGLNHLGANVFPAHPLPPYPAVCAQRGMPVSPGCRTFTLAPKGWQKRLDLNQRISESKSDALPLGNASVLPATWTGIHTLLRSHEYGLEIVRGVGLSRLSFLKRVPVFPDCQLLEFMRSLPSERFSQLLLHVVYLPFCT